MKDDNNSKLTEKDKEILNRLRPETHRKIQFFPSSDDLEERPWIVKNAWWILIIIGAIVISLL